MPWQFRCTEFKFNDQHNMFECIVEGYVGPFYKAIQIEPTKYFDLSREKFEQLLKYKLNEAEEYIMKNFRKFR